MNALVKTQETPVDFPDKFAQLRHEIDVLEQEAAQAAQGAQRGDDAAPRRRGRPPKQKGQSPMTDTTPDTPTQPTTQGMANKPTFDQLIETAKEFGEQAARGTDVQIKFDLSVFEAAYLGTIDTTPNKHGDGIDDATKLAEMYAKGRNSTVIFDHKELKQRKLCATTRLMVKLGGSPKWGGGEPMQTVNNLMSMRQNLRRTPIKGRKMDDAHNTLMRFARQQLKSDLLIPDDQLRAFCFKPDPEARSVEDWLNKIVKDAAKIQAGKLANCHEADTSPEIATIVSAAKKRLSALAKAAKGQAA